VISSIIASYYQVFDGILTFLVSILIIMFTSAITGGLTYGVIMLALTGATPIARFYDPKIIDLISLLKIDKVKYSIWLIIAIIYAPLSIALGLAWYNNIEPTNRPVVNMPVAYERFKLTAWTPTKTIYVTLVHTETGVIYDHQPVSRYCEAMIPNNMGSEYTVATQQWYYTDSPDKKYIRFLNLARDIC